MTTSTPPNSTPQTAPGVPALTPGQAAAAFTARMRTQATAAARPLNRTRAPGMFVPGTIRHFVYTDGGRLFALDLSSKTAPEQTTVVTVGETALPVPDQVAPVRVGFALLAHMVNCALAVETRHGVLSTTEIMAPVHPDNPAVTVVADQATLRLMLRLAEKEAKATGAPYEVKNVARALAYRKSLPHSGLLPVLTQALASRYWSPTAVDETTLDGWADAFGLAACGQARRVTGLIAAALDGDANPEYAKSMLNAERFGTSSAQYSGMLSASKAFRHASTVQSSHQALMNTDPLLAEFNICSGVVSRLNLTKIDRSVAHARVSDSFRLKPGPVLIFDPETAVGGSSKGHLEGVGYSEVDDALVARIKRGRYGEAGWWLIEEARKNHRPLYAVEAPFAGGGVPPKVLGRWTRPLEETVRRTDVPVDVAIAGAPEVA